MRLASPSGRSLPRPRLTLSAQPPGQYSPSAIARLGLSLLLLTLIIAVLPPRVSADPEPAAWHQVARLSSTARDAIHPQLSLQANGEISVLWEEPQSTAPLTVLRARSASVPQLQWVSVWPQSAPPPDETNLVYGPNGRAAWLISLGSTQMLGIRDTESGTLSFRSLPQDAYEVAFALTSDGHSQVAWAAGETVSFRTGGIMWAARTDIGRASYVSDLCVANDASGAASICWIARSSSGRHLGLYVWDPSEDDAHRVSSQGDHPRIVLDGLGTQHLFWLDAGVLYEATAPDWDHHVRVASPDSWETAAVAPGPDGVHFVWVENETLFHACSPAWEQSTRPVLSLDGPVRGIDLLVDHMSRLQVAWSAQDAEGVWSVRTCFFEEPIPQIAVLYPSGGETLYGDAVVRAESASFGADLVQVEFWAQAFSAQDQANGALYYVGIDLHGRDGWTAALRADTLENGAQYRLVALGTDARGRSIEGIGGWFTVYHADGLVIWPGEPPADAIRGTGTVSVLVGSTRSGLERVNLNLITGQTHAPTAIADATGVAVGTYAAAETAAWPQMDWLRFAFDSRAFPDGPLLTEITAVSADGQVARVAANSPFQIDNAMAPSIRVTSPVSDQVLAGEITTSAEAYDGDGRVERVAFYLEREQDGSSAWPEAGFVWLGTDSDGSDGWQTQYPVTENIDGGRWTVRAVAYDDNGLSGWARSVGTFTIVGYERPALHITSPSAERILKGTRMVRAYVDAGAPQTVNLFSADSSGSLSLLGPMQHEQGRWTYTWDTRSLADGTYDLLLLATDASGATSATRVEQLTVANAAPGISLALPTSSDELAGPATVSLVAFPDSSAINAVHLYYRDTRDVLRPIASDTSPKDGWSLLWDTTRVLDGPYDLVVYAVGTQGGHILTEQPVVVRNASPAIALGSISAQQPIKGEIPITWEVDHPQELLTTVDIEYSPDAGDHWLPVATSLPSDQTFAWDTLLFPDSQQGKIRLTASDGQHLGRAESALIRVDNTPEPPLVSCLAPKPSEVHSQDLTIAWQASDPDDDIVTVLLEYRKGTDPWQTIASLGGNDRSYRWPVDDLPPGDDYALRVTVTDAAGLVASDSVQRFGITDNAPPVVHLLAPKDSASISSQTVVLWSTHDPDDDPLIIDLYYSDDAGETWLPLAQDLPDTGYYTWQVSYLPSGSNYRLMIAASDNTHVSYDRSVTLLVIGAPQPPRIEITSPAPGSTVSDLALVQWHQNPLGGYEGEPTALYIRSSDGAWTELASDLPDNGVYLWDTRLLPDDTYILCLSPQEDGCPDQASSATVQVQNDPNRAPVVHLVSPSDAEPWYGLREIRWHADDADGDPLTATISCSTDAGGTWTTIDRVPGRQGYYVWDTRQADDGVPLLLRVEVGDGELSASDKTPGAAAATNGAWPPPRVTFLAPDDLGTLGQGGRAIWAAECSPERELAVSLYLSSDGGLTWEQIERATGDAGQVVLPVLEHGRDYSLRIVASDGIRRVAALSTRLNLSSLTQHTPQITLDPLPTGEALSGTFDLNWHTASNSAPQAVVDIAISWDGGHVWHLLKEAYPNTGTYTLDTTDWVDGIYIVQLTARVESGATVVESAPFAVTNVNQARPAISLLSPHGGEEWSGSKHIAWRVYDPPRYSPVEGAIPRGSWRVSLYYSTDGGASWDVIATDVPSDNGYIWDTSTAPNCDQMWVKAEATNGALVIFDVSNMPITIANADAPSVRLAAPEGPVWTGVQRLMWRTLRLGEASASADVTVEVSEDVGRTWRVLAEDLPPAGAYDLDTAEIPEGGTLLLRAVARSGAATGVDSTSIPVTIRGNPPGKKQATTADQP